MKTELEWTDRLAARGQGQKYGPGCKSNVASSLVLWNIVEGNTPLGCPNTISVLCFSTLCNLPSSCQFLISQSSRKNLSKTVFSAGKTKHDFLLIALIHQALPGDLSAHILDFWKCKFNQKQDNHFQPRNGQKLNTDNSRFYKHVRKWTLSYTC